MTQNALFCHHSLLRQSPHFCFWLSSTAWPVSSPSFPILCHRSLRIRFFHPCLRHRNKLAHQIVVTQWIHSFCCNVIFMISVRNSFQSDFQRFASFNNTSVFCLMFSNTAAGVPAALAYWSFTRHWCCHRNFHSNFPLAFFMIRMNSSSSGPIKKLPRNLLALSSFGFSMAHFWFSLRFDASDLPHIWPHFCRVLRSFLSSSVSSRTTYTHLVVSLSM